jgi:small redox-active disulfide protein 2
MIIEVLGKGCAKCEMTEKNVLQAMKELGMNPGIDVLVNHIRDIKMISARGVIMTPAVVINGVKMSQGRIPEVGEIKKWLEENKGK